MTIDPVRRAMSAPQLCARRVRMAAEDRAGADLRRRSWSSSTASSCGRSICRFTDSKILPVLRADGLRRLSAAVGAAELVEWRSRTSPSSACSISSSAWRSACCWPSCSTRRSAAKACCGRSISTRWRCPSSSPASPGNGSSIPASASSRPCINGAGRASQFDWIKNNGYGDLHRRHRRRLAGLRLRHGDVPRRPARHRRRDHEGGADRRRLDLPALSPHRHPAAAAGLPVGLHRARPPGDQVLRPGRRADRRRARAARPGCRRTSCIPTPSPATDGGRRRPAR